MTYFSDLAPYTYLPDTAPAGTDLRTIGWLDAEHDYPRGTPPRGFADALAHLCLKHPTAQTRGWHSCELPHPTGPVESPIAITVDGHPVRLGSSEVRVITDDGQWLTAPSLVLHYVLDHGYLPPTAFVDAVLAHKPAEDNL